VTFAELVLKNLSRQRVRSLLTILGITIGITAITSLGAVTAGLKATANAFVTSGEADFLVAQDGAADLSFSRIPETELHEIAAVRGVAAARGAFLHIVNVGSNPFFFLGGMTARDLRADPPDLVAGRLYRSGEQDAVVLGERAADDLGARVGQVVTISDQRMRVVGIFRSDVVWQNSGAYAPLKAVQKQASAPGSVTVAYVTAEPGTDPDVLAARIERQVPDVATISSAADYGKVDQGFALIDGANAVVTVLAVLIGGIGVMNTMIMSIFERTREIGVLRALGWKRARVMRMIVVESIALCAVGGAIGMLVGVGVSRLVVSIPAAKGFVVPAYPPTLFLQALVIALVVGLLGAAYPAYRATRLTPMQALRYE
jgi:putative ABC transport system permease protein